MNIMEETKRKLFDAILKMSIDEKANAYVDLNCYNWPESLEEFKPTCFSNSPRMEQWENELYQLAWKTILSTTSDFDRSKKWWELRIKDNTINHEDWYFEEMLKQNEKK